MGAFSKVLETFPYPWSVKKSEETRYDPITGEKTVKEISWVYAANNMAIAVFADDRAAVADLIIAGQQALLAIESYAEAKRAMRAADGLDAP